MSSRVFKNARILIVDDEPANMDLLRRLLERAGFSRIESTNDSREARRPLCEVPARPDPAGPPHAAPRRAGGHGRAEPDRRGQLPADPDADRRRHAGGASARRSRAAPRTSSTSRFTATKCCCASARCSRRGSSICRSRARTRCSRRRCATGRASSRRRRSRSSSGSRGPRSSATTTPASTPSASGQMAALLARQIGLSGRAGLADPARGAAARRRQDRHPRFGAAEARQADARGVRAREDAHDDRRADPLGQPVHHPAARRGDRVQSSRALGRRRLRRHRGSDDSARRPHRRGRRRVRRADAEASLQSRPGRSPRRSPRSIGNAAGSSIRPWSTRSCGSSSSANEAPGRRRRLARPVVAMQTRRTTSPTGLRQQCRGHGARGFVVGLSGGVDSAVVARLCQIATPAQRHRRHHAVPQRSARRDRMRSCVADAFRVPDRADRSGAGVRSARRRSEDACSCSFRRAAPTRRTPSTDANARVPLANIKPRLRMSTLYFVANSLNYLVAGTGNRSELTIGYFTKYGDGGVDMLPLGRLLKSEVRDARAPSSTCLEAIIDKGAERRAVGRARPTKRRWGSRTRSGALPERTARTASRRRWRCASSAWFERPNTNGRHAVMPDDVTAAYPIPDSIPMATGACGVSVRPRAAGAPPERSSRSAGSAACSSFCSSGSRLCS